MVECPDFRMYKACYIFDGVMKQGMIWVDIDCSVHKLAKALTSCCRVTSEAFKLTRKRISQTNMNPGNFEQK